MSRCRNHTPALIGESTGDLTIADERIRDLVVEARTALWSCSDCGDLLVAVVVRLPNGSQFSSPLTGMAAL